MPVTPRPRLVVHVGLPKTATTYLQRALFASASQLASAGIHLVRSGRLELEPYAVAHHHLAWQLFSPARFDPACGGWDDLAAELRSVDAHTALISSEELARVSVKGVRAELEERLLSLSDDVTVVVVVRDQLSLFNSTYVQRVKTLGATPPFSGYIDRSLAAHRFDLDRMFGSWYASDRIRLRAVPFSAVRSGDPLDTVLEAAGVPRPNAPLSSPDRVVNPSPGPIGVEAAMLLARYLRGHHPDFRPGSYAGRRLHRQAGKRLLQEGWCDGRFWGWSPRDAARVIDAYEASNDRFARAAWGTPWPEPWPTDRVRTTVELEDLDPRTVERVHRFVLAMTRLYDRLVEGVS